MTPSQPSPRPWTYDMRSPCGTIFDADRNHIATCWSTTGDNASLRSIDPKANAALIVQAVNGHGVVSEEHTNRLIVMDEEMLRLRIESCNMSTQLGSAIAERDQARAEAGRMRTAMEAIAADIGQYSNWAVCMTSVPKIVKQALAARGGGK